VENGAATWDNLVSHLGCVRPIRDLVPVGNLIWLVKDRESGDAAV
jgi:hypothetical protein